MKISLKVEKVSTRPDTDAEFAAAKAECRELFVRKMADYGTSWRVMRPSSFTDQIYIKARRVRSLQEKHEARVPEGQEDSFIGMVNYSVMALIQLHMPGSDDLAPSEAERLYDEMLDRATALMADKNHDYDEAWRLMRVSSITDIILQKLHRIKEIEDHAGRTCVSEGVEGGYMDIVNYSLFALILLHEQPRA